MGPRRAALAVMLVAGLGTSVGVAVGCSGSDPKRDETEIIHGLEDTNPAHDATILLLSLEDGQPSGTCSGTMVAPNLVLTARHCVSETDRGSLCKVDGTAFSGGKILSDTAPRDLLVYTGREARQNMTSAENAAARGKKVFTEDATVLCDRDVAFVLLDTSIDGPIAPLRLKSGAQRGELLTAVGWGLTEEHLSPRVRMQRADIPVEGIGPLRFNAAGVGLGPSEFLVGEAFCSGDSGGPAFSAKGAVVGVVSRGGNGTSDPDAGRAANCIGNDTINFYTHLAEKSALVALAFAESGFTPLDEDDIGKDAGAPDAGAPDAGKVDAAMRPITDPPEYEELEPTETRPTRRDAGTSLPPRRAAKAGCSAAPSTDTSSGLAGLALAGLALARRRRAVRR